MKITAITAQTRDPNRVNIMVDGTYRFSLDISQLIDLGVKVGQECSDEELLELETESQFGKLYARALEYSLSRPHSSKEVRDYLYRKTRTTMTRNKKTGELKERPGVSEAVTARVHARLLEKGYVNDEKFAQYWVENRNLKKGASKRKLQAELHTKGVPRSIIDKYLANTDRNDASELQKIIIKKRYRYDDDRKFMQYLARQGFSYDDIQNALQETD